MMTCRQVEHLLDAYLDGELSPSLRAEVHAHRLGCPRCQRRIELLEVCGDVIRMDRREPVLSADFADRVMAGFAASRRARHRRVPWVVRLAAPLAAAAAVAFAVLNLTVRSGELSSQGRRATVVAPAVVTNAQPEMVAEIEETGPFVAPLIKDVGGRVARTRMTAMSLGRLAELTWHELNRTLLSSRPSARAAVGAVPTGGTFFELLLPRPGEAAFPPDEPGL